MSQQPGQWGQQPPQGGQPGWPPQQGNPPQQGQPQYPQQPYPQQPQQPQQPQYPQQPQQGWGQQGGHQQPGGYQPQGGYQQGGYQGQPGGGYGGGGGYQPPPGGPGGGQAPKRSGAMIIGIVVAAVVLLVAVGGIFMALGRGSGEPSATITPTNTAPPTEDPGDDPTDGPSEEPSDDPSEQPSSEEPSGDPSGGSGGGDGEQVDIGNGVQVTIPSGWSDKCKKGAMARFSNGEDTWTGQTLASVEGSVDSTCDSYMKQIAEDLTSTKFIEAQPLEAGNLKVASCGVVGTATGNGGSQQVMVNCTMAISSDGVLGVSTVIYGPQSDTKQLGQDYGTINGSMFTSMN